MPRISPSYTSLKRQRQDKKGKILTPEPLGAEAGAWGAAGSVPLLEPVIFAGTDRANLGSSIKVMANRCPEGRKGLTYICLLSDRHKPLGHPSHGG